MHRWLGLAGAALVVLLSLSGSVLVFAEEIDAVLEPGLVTVTPCARRVPLDAMLANARVAYPDAMIVGFRRIPDRRDRSVVLTALRDGTWFVHVDPCDGRVLGARRSDAPAMRWLLRFHYDLMLERAGRWTSLAVGVLLCVTGVTGVFMLRKRLLGVFRRGIRRGAVLRDSHEVIGLAAVAFHVLVAVTGAWIQLRALDRAPSRRPPPPVAAHRSVDDLVARAGLEPVSIALPRGDGGRVTLRRGPRRVVLDARTGDVLAVEEPLEAWLLPLHAGTWGGLPAKVLYAGLGLTPAILAVTGLAMWLARRRRAITAVA